MTVLLLHPQDDVAVAAGPIAAGALEQVPGRGPVTIL